MRKVIRSASALKSTAGAVVWGIANGLALGANRASATAPRAHWTDFQAALGDDRNRASRSSDGFREALAVAVGREQTELLAFLGLVQLAIPCALAVICTKVLKAPEISLLALLEVIFGILLAWLGANEVPAPTVLTGGALVIGALVLNEALGWRERA